MLKEFKTFMLRGNVIDLAVGVIIGASFGKIVDSLVNDILMPVLGLILGRIDFANLFLVLSEGKTPGPYASLDVARKAGAAVFAYGSFINAVVYFMIMGFAIFMLVRAINRLVAMSNVVPEPAAPAEPPAPPPTPEDVVLLREIRDALRAGR
jgi:large conductance mechanosensitive channel